MVLPARCAQFPWRMRATEWWGQGARAPRVMDSLRLRACCVIVGGKNLLGVKLLLLANDWVV